MRPNKSVVVCMTPRSGSSLLCDYLAQTGSAGRPEEYFLADDYEALLRTHGVADGAGLVEAVVAAGTSQNGVFGVKVGIGGGYLSRMLRACEEATGERGVDGIWSAFGPPTFVWITRRDKVRQAISWWRAGQTGRWRSTDEGAPEPSAIDHDAVSHLLREVSHREAAWNQFFEESGIAPVTVVYEDFTRRRGETLLSIMRVLGENKWRDPMDTVLRRQADERTEGWRAEVLERAESDWPNSSRDP